MKIKHILNSSIVATLLLAFFICFIFAFAGSVINRLATESCFATLDESAAQTAAAVAAFVETNRAHLEVIADLMAYHADESPEIIQTHLSSLRRRNTVSAVGLLLPDNRLILGSDWTGDISNLDYAAEQARAPYLSGIVTAPDGSGRQCIYQAVPLKWENETEGILYGFVDLTVLAQNLAVTAFEGKAQVFVAERSTGDLLVDTWHDRLGNIFDSDIWSRKAKPGYDYQQVKEDFTAGRAGRIAFWSNTAGEYLYSSYMPVGDGQWMVQLTVPESVVLARAIQVRKLLYTIAGVEILLFAVYLLWTLGRVRKDIGQKNAHLSQSLYMYDVQQTLFDAYKSPDLFTEALDKVSDMLTAKASFFVTLDGRSIHEAFFSASAADRAATLSRTWSARRHSQISAQLQTGLSLLLYPDTLETLTDARDRADLAAWQIDNLMLVPVLDSDDVLIGILGSVNMKQRWKDCTLLECVSRNFLMALRNMKLYRQLEQASIIDALTGLQNRNRYEQALDAYAAQTDALCCLYIDANGLHELNNTLGHAAGDAMLICIGDWLQKLFSYADCYRIGGDEFAVLCTDCSEEVMQSRLKALCAGLEEEDYRIAAGFACLRESVDVKDMVACAEKRMNEDKRLYYQNAGNLSKARMMNQKLESILLEKRDSDAFLDIISSRFVGVYIVDLNTDQARIIFKPVYFSSLLEQHHHRFIPTMAAYIATCVVPEDQAGFTAFCDYDNIRRQLQKGAVPRFSYRKTDGAKLILRIYTTRNYSPDHAEVIWLFENAPV